MQTTRFTPTLLLILIAAAFSGCAIENSYSITKKHRIIISDARCRIAYNYPVLAHNSNKNAFYQANELLKQIGHYDSHAASCIKSARDTAEKRIVEGDFNVLMAADSILCIEFITSQRTGTAAPREVYSCIVIDPFTRKWRTLEELLPGFNRKMIYPYIEALSKKIGDQINILAYEEGSNYVITYGISKDALIIYPGDEGEGKGFYRVEIPLSELRLKLKEF